jgi:hypothetical protein
MINSIAIKVPSDSTFANLLIRTEPSALNYPGSTFIDLELLSKTDMPDTSEAKI